MKWSSIDIKWHTNFWHSSPIFSPLVPVLDRFTEFNDWPTLNDYNQRVTRSNSVRFVSQQYNITSFDQAYEPRIYLQSEVQTRENGRHDFFNFCVWQTFPKIKKKINELQYFSLKKGQAKRSVLENYLTHFDESGVIAVCSNPMLVKLWEQHQWVELFWHQRELVKHQMRFFLFGHALYEKALKPYIGFTGKTMVIPVAESFHHQAMDRQLEFLDQYIDQQLKQAEAVMAKKPLLPLPILGVPGWWPANENLEFYLDKSYFRG